jgi:hypothetical protein
MKARFESGHGRTAGAETRRGPGAAGSTSTIRQLKPNKRTPCIFREFKRMEWQRVLVAVVGVLDQAASAQ